MDSSIYGLIQELVKHHVGFCVPKDQKLGNRRDSIYLTRKFISKAYETLLSYHSPGVKEDAAKNWTVFDRLYATCFEKNCLGETHKAERLWELTDLLRKLPLCQNSFLSEILLFLLSLAQDDCEDANQLGVGFSLLPAVNNVTTGAHRYTCLPSHVFEKVGMDFSRQRYSNELLDAKVFSMKPGFISATCQLKCSQSSLPLLQGQPSSTALIRIPIRPLTDPWKLDSKLEIPELPDEPEVLLNSLSDNPKKVMARVPAMVTNANSKGDRLTNDEDEGFIETDSPTSSNSFGHTVDDAVIWDLALTKDYLKNPTKRYRTWESLGCLESISEKPFLTDAGPEAVDHLLISMQTELSITCPDEAAQTLLNGRQCDPFEVVRTALNVLMGIPSHIFSYDEESCSFAVSPVFVSGLSQQSLLMVLKKFAASGTDHIRLEQLAASDGSCSSVFQAFAKGVRRYLFHRQVTVTFLLGQQTGRSADSPKHHHLPLLYLLGKTDRLRNQTRFLADLCGLADGSTVTLPTGVGLLQHVYEAAAHVSCNPHLFPVALSLLHHASQPYFLFLKKWAFEGICEDRYGEFPIAVNENWIDSRNSVSFWDHYFVLRVESDPILTSLLPKVLVCGKSIDLLRRCCLHHHLCSSKRSFPSLTLVFSETDMQQMVAEHQRYIEEIESIWQRQQQGSLRKSEGEVSTLTRMQEPAIALQKMSISSRGIAKVVSTEMEVGSEDMVNSSMASPDGQLSTVSCETRSWKKQPLRLVQTPIVNMLQDANANPIESLPLNEGVLWLTDSDRNENTIINPMSNFNSTTQSAGPTQKGTKRKQDRESIDFEVLAARRPMKMDGSGGPVGILVEGSTFQVLRPRGRSAHGHVSDSTIQKLLYGSTYLKLRETTGTNIPYDSAKPVADDDSECLDQLLSKVFSRLTVPSYEIDLTKPVDPVHFSIGNFSSSPRKSSDPSFWKNQSLPALFNCCILKPLRIQIALVNRALLDYFFQNLKLRDHFLFLHDHFFMQDGEFSQCLCDSLFERFNRSASPSDLLNPLTLNLILSKALSYSASSVALQASDLDKPCDFESSLSFVVKFVPQTFQRNSPNVLDCLGLTYRVDFPTNLVLSAKVSKYYERIFGFLLQLRRCLWATMDMYHVLKLQDPAARSRSTAAASTVSVKQYRLLQLYRHEMHHFLSCLQEHLSLQAFQSPYRKFNTNLVKVQSLDELIELHIQYLQKVFFRCLLHKKAAPLMKIVRKIFAIVLKFHSQLLVLSLRRRCGSPAFSSERFAQLQASYKIFKDYSTYLFKVITKLVSRSCQPSLQKFLTRLDCNDWYSSAVRLTKL